MSEAGGFAAANETSLRSLVAQAGDWYWETDAAMRLRLVQSAGGRRSPWPLADWIGKREWEITGALVQPAGWDEHRRERDALLPFSNLVVRRALCDQSEGVAQLAGVPAFGSDGIFLGYIGIGRDVTAHFRAQDLLRQMAEIDPLTGLLNRQSFDERAQLALAQAYAHGSQCALLCIGIDQFQLLNGVYGHRTGDRMLAAAAERLQRRFGAPDLLGRRDGAEIVALLVDIGDAERATAAAREVIEAVRAPEPVGAMEITVRASVGVSFFPKDGGDLDALLNAGDTALYRAKAVGGGALALFTPELARRTDLRARLEQRLRKAYESRDFRLFYQPLVSLPTGRLVGAEALLRWKDGELGDIEPGEFIPIAEESGLIEGVGDWVLREACRQRQLWRQVGLDLPPIAINVSGVQLRNGNFVDGLLAALEEFDGTAEELEVEITETGLMDCGPESLASLVRLRDAGIRTALDDFGVGYSSLAHLRDLPMYRLKIDRSFTVECMRDARTLTIVKSVIEMAHNLGLTVTAEGIETAEQQDWMHQLGCDSAQGYFFARPMPAEEFLQRFLDARARADAGAAARPF